MRNGEGRQTVTTLAKAAVLASQYEKSGRLVEAESICRQILATHPNHPDTLLLFSSLLLRRGDFGGAIDALERARVLEGNPIYDRHMGMALAAAGRSEEAEKAFVRALRAGEDDVLLNDLGKTYANLGRLEEAADCFRRAIGRNPDFVPALTGLGRSLILLDRFEEALEPLLRALETEPERIDDTPYLIGKALHALGRLEEALPYYEMAIRDDPTHLRAHNDLGAALTELNRPNPAVMILKSAIRLMPNTAELHFNLGNAYTRQRRVANALSEFERAIELSPDFAVAHFNRGIALLTLGDYKAGWPEYEWRWKTPTMIGSVRSFPIPQWNGGDIDGKTILLHAEQGLGDAIQFIRYVPWVASKEAYVVVECSRLLHGLFSSVKGLARLIDQAESGTEAARGAFDFHLPLMSLPGVHGTTAHNMPCPVPYLAADRSLSRAWGQTIDSHGAAYKVGLVWQGNPDHQRDRFRSVPLQALRPVFDIPGVAWISLQKDSYPGMTDGAPNAVAPSIPRLESGAGIGDFADTAAIVDSLDLVISIDTSVAHLAGALGKPVWLMLPVDSDWRWLLDREDSPWYPTMRLFRQRAPGAWGEVTERLKAALAEAVNVKRSRN